MTTTIVLIALVLLTAATVLLSRAGARQHQESLNSHTMEPFTDGRDRPAGPGAERMVEEPSEGAKDA